MCQSKKKFNRPLKIFQLANRIVLCLMFYVSHFMFYTLSFYVLRFAFYVLRFTFYFLHLTISQNRFSMPLD